MSSNIDDSEIKRKTIISVPVITGNIPLWITFFVLLYAKLFGSHPEISWIWVTCPLWIFFAIFVASIVFIFGIAGICILLAGIICLISMPFLWLSDLYDKHKKKNMYKDF